MVRDFAIRVKQALAIRFHDIGHDGCAIDMGLGLGATGLMGGD
jgi:hypothetical protein